MKEATSQHLFSYWNEVRGDRIAPKRFEIEPSRIAQILPDTFILERIDVDTARFRLAGTRICEAFVAEFRGTNFFELFSLDDRVTLKHQFNLTARQGAVVVFTLQCATESGKTCTVEGIVAPLFHTRETVDRYLGSLAVHGAPEWLGSEPIVSQRLVDFELIWPDGRPHSVFEAHHRQSPFTPHMRNARVVRIDRRNFRVYDGGLSKPDDKQTD